MNARNLIATGGSFLLLMTIASYCTTKSGATKPVTHTVTIEAMKFQPDTLNVRQGDTVLFVNRDIVTHDATEVNKNWFSPPLETGGSWKWVADKSADYYCSIHLIMKGKIIVD